MKKRQIRDIAINVRVDKKTFVTLHKIGTDRDSSLSRVVRLMIKQGLERYQQRKLQI